MGGDTGRLEGATAEEAVPFPCAARRSFVLRLVAFLCLFWSCPGVTPCSHNPARMTAGSVRQGGNLMRVPSSPRLSPPFDGGRTGRQFSGVDEHCSARGLSGCRLFGARHLAVGLAV